MPSNSNKRILSGLRIPTGDGHRSNSNFGDSSFVSICMNLDYDGGMDNILQNSRQVFVTMPAKAAGTAMQEFTSTKCTGSI